MDAPESTLLRAANANTSYHLVTVGQEILHGDIHIRESVEVQTEELARSLRQARWYSVIDCIRGDELVQRGQVLPINDLIKKSLNKSLVVIGCHWIDSFPHIHVQVILIPPSAEKVEILP